MESRINVLLDLDNTIINALEDEERKNLPTYFQDKFKHEDMLPFFRVFARPHLEEFLDYLFANFNVGVFTAAEHMYAKFIIDKFILTKPNRKLDVVLFRYHFDLSHKLYNKTKGLELLWDFTHLYNYYPCNTVIIDDLSDVLNDNPYNTIPVESFDMIITENADLTNRPSPSSVESKTITNAKPNWDAINDTTLLRVMKQLSELKSQYDLSDCVSKIYNSKPKYEAILEMFQI